jgi:hypothetical protein
LQDFVRTYIDEVKLEDFKQEAIKEAELEFNVEV